MRFLYCLCRIENQIFLILCLLLISCAPATARFTPTAATPISPSASATPLPTHTHPAPTPTITSTPWPTAIFTPTLRPTDPPPTPTYDTLRRTPPTLMLHKSNPDFDVVKFMEGFIPLVKAHQLRPVTYQQITAQPDITAQEAGRLFIFTIDDVSLQAPIDPSIQSVIALLRRAGYPAVLGIVSAGELPDAKTAAQLKELAAEGWELANHTDGHVDLHASELVAPKGTRLEIRACNDKVFAATGVRPITVVLPYGNMVANLEILTRENMRWAVGITGGERYRTTNAVYYVGREGPTPDVERTMQALLDRFNPPQP